MGKQLSRVKGGEEEEMLIHNEVADNMRLCSAKRYKNAVTRPSKGVLSTLTKTT